MTDWRTIGDVSPEVWSAQLASVGSPLTIVAMSCYRAAQPHTALCLAMLNQESSYAKRFNRNVESNYNPLNLRPPDGDGYLGFAGWTEGIRAWRERLTDPTYKGGVYARTRTIAELIHVYAPASDSNNESAYVAGIESDLNRWGITPKEQPVPASVTLYPVAGLPEPGIALPVPLIQQIIPRGQTNQRPGIPRQLPGFWVQHETANTTPGADAAMHARWLNNGAGGAELSFHFAVDDGVIYQMIPIDEVTWQAADGAGPGNMSGISCELCVNRGIDTDKSRHNAEALCAAIFKQLGLGVDRVKAHYDFNGALPPEQRHHCPDTMLNDGYWPVTFKSNVAALLRNVESPKPKAAPIWWTPGDIGIQKRASDGYMALAMVGEVTATKPVTIRTQLGDGAEDIVTLKQGEKRKLVGTTRAKDKRGTRIVFVETFPGSGEWGRANWSSFNERFPVP